MLAGPIDIQPSTRTVALFEHALDFLDTLGLRAPLQAHGAPLVTMRIVDDTGSIFPHPPVEFHASEIGLDAFGWNIENAQLLQLMAGVAHATRGLRHEPQFVTGYEISETGVSAKLGNGATVHCKLVAAADGARSLARKAAGVKVQTSDYPQIALTAVLAHQLAHQNVSTEFHTREGPFTLVPLPDGDQGEHKHTQRSSLVWLMHPRRRAVLEAMNSQDLALTIEKQSHYLLGKMKLLHGPAFVPMHGLRARAFARARIALIGEAAHVFPPIGAQGLNLGLRDSAALAQCLGDKSQQDFDPGNAQVIQAYDSARRADIVSRSFGVDLLDRALLSRSPLTDLVRATGLSLLAGFGPLRRLAMREGIAPNYKSREGVAPGFSNQVRKSRP